MMICEGKSGAPRIPQPVELGKMADIRRYLQRSKGVFDVDDRAVLSRRRHPASKICPKR